ncbi:MAG: hypothetical protein RIC14_10975 [Filomicrobium sp.]
MNNEPAQPKACVTQSVPISVFALQQVSGYSLYRTWSDLCAFVFHSDAYMGPITLAVKMA